MTRAPPPPSQPVSSPTSLQADRLRRLPLLGSNIMTLTIPPELAKSETSREPTAKQYFYDCCPRTKPPSTAGLSQLVCRVDSRTELIQMLWRGREFSH
jgi:hypothetical protein